MGRWTRKYRHGRTLEGGALTALTLTKKEDFNRFLLPLLVALGFEHLVDIIANFLCLFFGPETLFSVSGGFVRGRKKGGGDGVRERVVSVRRIHVENERGRGIRRALDRGREERAVSSIFFHHDFVTRGSSR